MKKAGFEKFTGNKGDGSLEAFWDVIPSTESNKGEKVEMFW